MGRIYAECGMCGHETDMDDGYFVPEVCGACGSDDLMMCGDEYDIDYDDVEERIDDDDDDEEWY